MRFLKLFVAGGLALAAVLAPRAASACGDDVVIERQIRPIDRPIVQPVVNNAQALLAEASSLDSQATVKEANATTLDKEASDVESRAVTMRSVAMGRSEADREMILARADALSAQAMVLRTQASQRRGEATSLRSRAQSLRLIALRQNGGGWHGRPQAKTAAVTL